MEICARQALSAFATATLGFNKVLDYAPRNWTKALTRH
jgi:hypothetical protein